MTIEFFFAYLLPSILCVFASVWALNRVRSKIRKLHSPNILWLIPAMICLACAAVLLAVTMVCLIANDTEILSLFDFSKEPGMIVLSVLLWMNFLGYGIVWLKRKSRHRRYRLSN